MFLSYAHMHLNDGEWLLFLFRRLPRLLLPDLSVPGGLVIDPASKGRVDRGVWCSDGYDGKRAVLLFFTIDPDQFWVLDVAGRLP